MLTVQLPDFMIEMKEGVVKHVGPSNKHGIAKLYDVTAAEVSEFGDERVKCSFADDEGNEVEVALFPEEADALVDGIESLEGDSPVFE